MPLPRMTLTAVARVTQPGFPAVRGSFRRDIDWKTTQTPQRPGDSEALDWRRPESPSGSLTYSYAGPTGGGVALGALFTRRNFLRMARSPPLAPATGSGWRSPSEQCRFTGRPVCYALQADVPFQHTRGWYAAPSGWLRWVFRSYPLGASSLKLPGTGPDAGASDGGRESIRCV